MKPFPFLNSLGATVALCGSVLQAETTPPSNNPPPSGTTHLSEWSLGFEAAEGYAAGPAALRLPLSVLGGTATIVAGDAAQGAQFLRFVPTKGENALIINRPNELSVNSERLIRFAVRLRDGSPNTRLVLSYGETVALRPVEGGLQIEAGIAPPQVVKVSLPANGWIEIGLRENSRSRTWDLLIAGQPALSNLALQEPSALLSNLLIFADGSLDLDAVYVADTEIGSAAAPGGPSGPKAPTSAVNPNRSGLDPAASQRGNESLTEAMERAKEGSLAAAAALVASAIDLKQNTPPWHLEMARGLATLAYALHDGGYGRAAVGTALESLKHLQSAEKAPDGAEGSATRATAAFITAQLWEDVLADRAEADQAYRRTLAADAGHPMAKAAIERRTLETKETARKNAGQSKEARP